MGFWCIPNFPHNTGTYFMTPEMSEMAQYRMIVSAGGRSEDDEGGAWEGVKLACKDPFTWIYTVLHFGLIVALSFKDFFPSVSRLYRVLQISSKILTSPDCENSGILEPYDLPHPSSAVCLRLPRHLRNLLVVRKIPGALLAYSWQHSCMHHRRHHHDLHPERRCAILRHVPFVCRTLCWPECTYEVPQLW
jgi:hypothetical protein